MSFKFWKHTMKLRTDLQYTTQYTTQYTKQYTTQYTTNIPRNIPSNIPSNIPHNIPHNIPRIYHAIYHEYTNQYTTNIPSNIPRNIPYNIPHSLIRCQSRRGNTQQNDETVVYIVYKWLFYWNRCVYLCLVSSTRIKLKWKTGCVGFTERQVDTRMLFIALILDKDGVKKVKWPVQITSVFIKILI